MEKEELIARSPVRVFMQSISGGLKPGEVGVLASQSGIGKTSVLVQIALDKLLRGKKVIHVSFAQHADYVIGWYENIFGELVDKKDLENMQDVRDEVIRNRVLMNFSQEGMTAEQILRSLKAMMVEGGFNADALIIDGFDFSKAGRERLESVKRFAAEMGVLVWYSCNLRGSEPGFPSVLKPFEDLIDVLIQMEGRKDYIELTLTKNRGPYTREAMSLRLDPGTLLMQ